jgi:dTDP-glucose pyrophosphorylase/predicted transcriptional regulator
MNNWKKVILKPSNTMSKALEALETEGLGIIMVADNHNKLLGTVTDGDIRRALMQQKDANTLLEDIMRKNPITISAKHTQEQVISIMKQERILQLPVVDELGVIVDLEMITDALDVEKRENIVFIMAGGFGTRLQPLTDNTPKPLLMIGDKPILEIILNQFIESGFHNFIISTHYKAIMLHEYFGDGSKWGINIEYVYEESPIGTAGALGLLQKNITNLPILVMNGDLLTKVDFESFLNFHNTNTGIASICVREYDMQVPYGVVNSSNHKLTGIVEKPINKFFVNAGIYIINPSVLESLDGKTYLDMPDLLQRQVNKNFEVNVFPLHEYWLDIGHLENLQQAQRDSKSIF